LDEANLEALKEESRKFLLNKDEEFVPLKCRYVLAIIEEYSRCLMEHQIP